jgi:hypothetical protein
MRTKRSDVVYTSDFDDLTAPKLGVWRRRAVVWRPEQARIAYEAS